MNQGTVDEKTGSGRERDLADPIARNISDILELESKEFDSQTRTQRWLDAAGRNIARPGYLVGLLTAIVLWVVLNAIGARLRIASPDPPPFHWLQGLLTLTALLTTTVVLIGQARLSRLAEQRTHLDLQINLLTEQKVTKLIHLIEELRAGRPGVEDRHDPHLSELKKPTDATQLASALKQRDASGDPP